MKHFRPKTIVVILLAIILAATLIVCIYWLNDFFSTRYDRARTLFKCCFTGLWAIVSLIALFRLKWITLHENNLVISNKIFGTSRIIDFSEIRSVTYSERYVYRLSSIVETCVVEMRSGVGLQISSFDLRHFNEFKSSLRFLRSNYQKLRTKKRPR